MDEYAEFIYQRRPDYRPLSVGDVSAQKELRLRLGCKSFRWFMTEVAWDLEHYYPAVEPPAGAWGEVHPTHYTLQTIHTHTHTYTYTTL